MPSAPKVPAALVAVTLVFSAAGNALADPQASRPDTTYGRMNGDLTLVGGIGAVASSTLVRPLATLHVRYLESAGLYFDYEDGAAFGLHSNPERVLTAGLEARPLFLARWLSGSEFGTPHLDLALDSLGIEFGANWSQPQGGSIAARPGFTLGLGLEIPIQPAVTGVWLGLHGGIRWSEAALAGAPLTGPDSRQPFLSLSLTWHQLVNGHVSDVGDRAPR